MFRKILGPSPLLCGVKKIHSHLFFHGGSKNDACLSDEEFFEMITEIMEDPNNQKPRRLTNCEVVELFSARAKLTKEQRLLKSVLKEATLSNNIAQKGFQNIEQMYDFRRKYKTYLRIKRFVPLGLVAPFTGTELSKMAYAATLGSKSVSLTLPGLFGRRE